MHVDCFYHDGRLNLSWLSSGFRGSLRALFDMAWSTIADLQVVTNPFAQTEIVVPDLEMQRLDGFGVWRQLALNPAYASLPVIVVTATNRVPHVRFHKRRMSATRQIPSLGNSIDLK